MAKFMKNCGIIALGMIGIGIILSIISGINRGWKPIPIGELVYSATNGRIRIPGVWTYYGWEYWDNYWDNWDGHWKQWGDNWKDMELVDLDDIDNWHGSQKGNVPGTFDEITGDRNQYSPGSGIQNLDVDISEYYMEICTSQDGEFHVETANGSNLQCYVKNNTLYLETPHHTHRTGDLLYEKGVRLYVPEGTVFSKVDVDFGAGALQMGNLTADKMDVDFGMGWISAQGNKIGTLDISIGGGSAELRETQVDTLTVEVGMGSMEFDGSLQNKGDVECGMGSITMQLDGKDTDFNYDIESAMGSVTIGTREYGGLAQGRKINNGAAKKITIECAMGSIEISFSK